MRSSRSARLASVAIGATCAIFVFLTVGLDALAVWAETHSHAYPYKAGEDPLRFLLPSIMGRPGRGRIMLTGPSAAAEGLLYGDIDRAFPAYDAYQAAFSTATVDDVLLSLDYIEREYGRGALPEVMVIGGEPRFFNNLPRRFGPTREPDAFSPFISLIDRYSPLHVTATPEGSVLMEKTRVEKLEATARFRVSKQRPRWRVGIAAVLNRVLNGPGPNLDLLDALPPIADINDPLTSTFLRDAFSFAARVGPYTALRHLVAAYASPYRAELKGEAQAVRPDPYSRLGHWNSYDASLMDAQVTRLVNVTNRLDIRLFVVMLPRHPANAVVDDALPTGEFDAALRRALGRTPYLDLQTLLDEHYFADGVHLNRAGAHRVTTEVVKFMKLHGGP